jgi:molecular chaperone DnaK (HSP70)
MDDTIDLGIDFGTTRTVVAVCDRGNYPVLGFIGPDGTAIEWYPSVIAEKDGVLTFGLDALAAAAEGATLVRSFKRWLSAKDVFPGTIVEVGSVSLEIVDLVARFLAALRRDILERSNLPVKAKKGAAMRCVVATPANAHSTQRFITLEAFRRAGFEVVALLNEPSAAGVEYAHRYRNTITSKREHILVYDLGGGTFDASLVRMSGKSHDVVASSGLSRLGGDDFDQALFDLIDRPGLSERALEACCDAKERINPNTKRIAIDLKDGVVQVPVEAYYERCAPLVAETIATMKRVLLRDGGEDVAGIYVVGGASSLPVIARMLRDEYGRRVHRSAYPSAATAIGLAIAMDERSGYEITERFSHHFGVFREARGGAEVAFDPIFDEAIVQPTAAGASFEEVRQYRAVHNVGHFRYIECGWLDEDGVPSGDITPFAEVLFPFDPTLRAPDLDLRAVPVERTGEEAGPLVEERYSILAGGIVELTIRDLDTGFESRHRLS